MEKEEIELTRSVIKLAEEMHQDRISERVASIRKYNMLCFICCIVTSVFILSMCLMWIFEIRCSYDYSDFTIENKASATITSEVNK